MTAPPVIDTSSNRHYPGRGIANLEIYSDRITPNIFCSLRPDSPPVSEDIGGRDPIWWWKAAATALLGLSATLLIKGCDEWQKTNAALLNLSADVKYQIDRVGTRERRLEQVEQNLTNLYDRTQKLFEERRLLADRIIDQVDERLDRLERYLPEQSMRPPADRR